ncbi:membrane protein [Clostridia bacterium]|nr:membrane protein [Clostridia bacterium]
MLAFFIALFSGALMSIQGVFNTAVTEKTSIWVAASWVQLTALITCLCFWLCTGKQDMSALFAVERKYVLLGGVIGALITYTVIQSVQGLGPAKAILLIVVSQLLVAYVIELLGLFGVEKVDFELKKLIGMVLAIVGIAIFH